jgi:hypothetical protein
MMDNLRQRIIKNSTMKSEQKGKARWFDARNFEPPPEIRHEIDFSGYDKEARKMIEEYLYGRTDDLSTT